MHGYGDSDHLQGDKGSDHIYGDAGDDGSLWGGTLDPNTNTYTDTSDDYVHGGSGADTIHGGVAQGGVDRLYGEAGNDLIRASQREHNMNTLVPNVPLTKEIIDCGGGARDEVQFDKGLDVVTNCEIKHPFS